MVDNCSLVLNDGYFFEGSSYSFNQDTDLANPYHHMRDNEGSAKLEGSCKNTSYLVFEHPWEHENGGLAYLIGESDKPGNLWKTDQNDYEKGRYWTRANRADKIVRINIPSENINEGQMREDIKIYGKRNTETASDTHLHLYRSNNGNPNASDQWLIGTHSNGMSSVKKGKPCPGGDAYWKNAIEPEISCVYKNIQGIQTLHGEIKNSFSGDPRKAMYTNIVNRYCNSGERLNDVISSDTSRNQCRDVVDSTKLAKEYCKIGDNIATDSTFCTKKDLGDNNYNELAEKYCENNPDKEFCGCYNVTQPGLCEQVPIYPGVKQ